MDIVNEGAVQLKLEFGSVVTLGTLKIDVDPSAMMLGLNSPGPETTVDSPFNAFTQTGNKLGLSATVQLTGTGLLDGQVPTDPQDMVTETDFELQGFLSNQSGTLQLTLIVDSQNAFDLDGNAVSMDISGQIAASGPYLPGAASLPETVNLSVISPAAVAEAQTPGPFRLTGVYPNPVRGRATIELSLDAAADVDVAVFDLLGREVDAISAGRLSIGEHDLEWDASALPSGLYVVRLSAGARSVTKSVVVQ
jgi:hypothetical protein